MSGGLDSTAIAAAAAGCFGSYPSQVQVGAFTEVFDELIAHNEHHFAALVGQTLGLSPHRYMSCESPLYDWIQDPREVPIEPVGNPLWGVNFHGWRQAARHSRILLYGDGPDESLQLPKVYFSGLLKRLQVGQFCREVVEYIRLIGRIPTLGILHKLSRLRAQRWTPQLPTWLRPQWIDQFALPQRHSQVYDLSQFQSSRDVGIQLMTSTLQAKMFETKNDGAAKCLIAPSYPFYDLRMVRYLLSLPSIPWCLEKRLLRLALQDIFPASVHRRPKTTLHDDPVIALLQRPEAAWLDQIAYEPETMRFFDPSLVPHVAGEDSRYAAFVNLRPRTLNFWIRAQKQEPAD